MTVPQPLIREMGLNMAEFNRSITSAVEPHTYLVDGRVFTVLHPDGKVTITLAETVARRIAMLSIPQTQVTFDFGGLGVEARVAFMTRFDRYFHRGGG